MTNSPWSNYAVTGSPLDYTPIDAPIVAAVDSTPERPSRLFGYAVNVACVICGVLVGLLF